MAKSKVTTTTTDDFVITVTKSDELAISTKTYDWKVTLSPGTRHHQIVKHYISNNTMEELNMVLDLVYVTTTTMLTDMGLGNVILKYFKDIEETPLAEIVDEDDAEILKQVKDETTASDNE